GGSAFVVLQVVDVVAEGLNLSPGVLQAVTLLILAGFPIALALAWAFQVTPEGLRRTDPATTTDLDAIAAQPRGQRWPAGILGLLGGIAIATAGWWALGSRPATDEPGARAEESTAALAEPADVYLASLAVLPFANRSDHPENEYFTDGVHDDILTALSRLEDLKLISRTSVMRYRDTETSIGEIGRELGVATVLEGSVQRSGERVRITVQLIDAETDNHLWAETYDEELTAANVFAIQSDVARQIASALEATLVVGEPSESRPPPTESLEAYDRLTEARFLLASRGSANMFRAADLFREAIALDSNYAPAHTGLAEAYLLLYSWDQVTLEEIKPIIESSLDRALELDPLLGEAHTARALFLRNLGRFDESETAWRRAIELVPGHADTHHWFGIMLWELGRFDESRIELRRALALDPMSRIINTNVGFGEYFARDYDTAIAQYERALERFPDFSYTWILLSAAYSLNGQHQNAVQAAQKSLELSPGDSNWTLMLAAALVRAGDEAEARRVMASASAGDPTRFALVHAALGDTDEAFRWLDLALETGSPFITELGDPAYDPIRDDPRFQAALRRVGLVE
ncbi:MAG: tetratricopeptide repeat protein, partial [Gemmatimonadetes bacterium]|nr:tetratricopeptide repeat protein [Gemmatimonadota bacterium]